MEKVTDVVGVNRCRRHHVQMTFVTDLLRDYCQSLLQLFARRRIKNPK